MKRIFQVAAVIAMFSLAASAAGKKVIPVANPELLRDHVGHHVQVEGTLDNDTLTVASVTMLKDQSMK